RELTERVLRAFRRLDARSAAGALAPSREERRPTFGRPAYEAESGSESSPSAFCVPSVGWTRAARPALWLLRAKSAGRPSVVQPTKRILDPRAHRARVLRAFRRLDARSAAGALAPSRERRRPTFGRPAYEAESGSESAPSARSACLP